MSIQDLIKGLEQMREKRIAGTIAGLEAAAAQQTAELKLTTVHGDQTGATRAGYVAYVIGQGKTGAAELEAAIEAVEELNPGRSATTSIDLDDQAIGLVLTTPTDYQRKLETENGGAKANLGPTIANVGLDITAAAAAGSKAAQ